MPLSPNPAFCHMSFAHSNKLDITKTKTSNWVLREPCVQFDSMHGSNMETIHTNTQPEAASKAITDGYKYLEERVLICRNPLK